MFFGRYKKQIEVLEQELSAVKEGAARLGEDRRLLEARLEAETRALQEVTAQQQLGQRLMSGLGVCAAETF
tara:strand:- start:15 stop:227 length:213 start_codon:yes stop_codon:yes gene_type:complete